MRWRALLLVLLLLAGVEAAQAPTIVLAETSVSTPEETARSLLVTVDDADTALAALTVTVTNSSNSALIRVNPADWVVAGNGTDSPTRTLTLSPRPDAVGSTTLTVQVSDGGRTATATLTLIVTNVNDAPVITGLPASASTPEDVTYGPQGFSIQDPDSSAFTVTLTESRNTAIVEAGNVSLTGSGTSWILTITPKADRSSTAPFDLIFTVSDGAAASNHVLSFTVLPVDDPAAFTANPLPNVTHVLGQAPVALSGLAALSDPDGFAAAGTRLEARLVNVAAAGFTNPLAEDELVVLPVAGVGMSGSGPFTLTVPNGSGGQRAIATTAGTVTGSASLELAIAATCTAADLPLLPACLRYRNRLGAAGSTPTRRAELRFLGSGPGSNGSGARTQVDIAVASTDPPGIRVLTDLLVAPLGTAVLSPQRLETINTDTITLATAPQFGQLRKDGIALLVGGASFTQADIAAGRITYSHLNANATFDQLGLRLAKGALSTLVTVLVRVVPTLTDYQILSDPPLAIRASRDHVVNLGILVPSGLTETNVWYVLEQSGTCSLTFNQSAGTLTLNAPAAGEVAFLLCYGPSAGSTAPVARQRVRLVVVPADSTPLGGGGG